MITKFKVGDKVRCIDEPSFVGGHRLDDGSIYTIHKIDNRFVYLEEHKKHVGWYPHRFELAEKSLESLIKHAQSLLGKKCVMLKYDNRDLSYTPQSVVVKFPDNSNPSSVEDYLKTHDFCVAVTNNIGYYPAEWLEAAQSFEVKLNDNYTAIVTKDGIKVGCQTFPLSIAHDLINKVNELK
jgi:hypothetical protein